MNNFFAYINRMRFIQRWSLMRNSYTENIPVSYTHLDVYKRQDIRCCLC